MPEVYYVHPSYVCYLGSTAPGGLRFEIEAGRCNIYWDYIRRGEFLRACAHIEHCDACRDWLDRCDEMSGSCQETDRKER